MSVKKENEWSVDMEGEGKCSFKLLTYIYTQERQADGPGMSYSVFPLILKFGEWRSRIAHKRIT